MSFQASRTVASAISPWRRSAGSLCTTPPGTRRALIRSGYSAGQIRGSYADHDLNRSASSPSDLRSNTRRRQPQGSPPRSPANAGRRWCRGRRPMHSPQARRRQRTPPWPLQGAAAARRKPVRSIAARSSREPHQLVAEGDALGQVHAEGSPCVFTQTPNPHRLGGLGGGGGVRLASLHVMSKPSAGAPDQRRHGPGQCSQLVPRQGLGGYAALRGSPRIGLSRRSATWLCRLRVRASRSALGSDALALAGAWVKRFGP